LRNSSDFDNISSYADEAVSRIFFMHEKSIFNQADILNEKNFEMLFGLSRTLEKTILKALGLRWLKMDMNKKNISTAGRGE
jgi:predicted HAD superfamily hydrolase